MIYADSADDVGTYTVKLRVGFVQQSVWEVAACTACETTYSLTIQEPLCTPTFDANE